MSGTALATAPASQAPAQSAPLPEAVSRRGIDEAQWRTLCGSLFPGAEPASVLMVIDYCKARKLDPMKKPCHIVPIKVKDARSGNYEWRDVVMAGIYEYRTTAMRTGNYLGHSAPEFGPEIELGNVKAPEWCAMTMFRASHHGDRIEFPVRVYFRECVALKDGKPNDRWSKAPIQMLTKCTEAAGLREAFPDEFGGETTAEEMDGQDRIIDVQPAPVTAAPRLSQQQAASPVVEGQTVEQPAKTVEAPKNVGLIAEVIDKGTGAIVKLDTGFTCSTRDAEMMKSAASLRDRLVRVEMVTRPSSDPTKYAPVLTEIVPVPQEPAK